MDIEQAEALAAPKEWQVNVQVWKVKMEVCSNDFNQQIPAIEPVQIDTAALVDEKMKMLDTLDDIAVTQQMGANANARAAGGGGGGGGGIGGGGPPGWPAA